MLGPPQEEVLSPLCTTQCTFHIGEKEFKFNFIVCKHLLRPVIIGVDFSKTKSHICRLLRIRSVCIGT